MTTKTKKPLVLRLAKASDTAANNKEIGICRRILLSLLGFLLVMPLVAIILFTADPHPHTAGYPKFQIESAVNFNFTPPSPNDSISIQFSTSLNFPYSLSAFFKARRTVDCRS